MAISDKLTYLNETKSQLKDMINYGLDDNNKITNSTTFRNYVSSIFNAFLEALKTPDTLFTNLPKKSGTGANITLNDTANAPMRIELGATELTQAGTPTPSSPQDIHTISGSNKVVVSNSDNTISQEADIDLDTLEYCKIGNYEDKFIRTSGKNLFDISVATNDYLFTKTGDVFTSSPLSAYVVPKIKLGRSINVKNGQDYYISYDIKLDSGDVKNLNYFGRLSDTGSLAKNTNFGSLVGSFTISNQYQRVVWKTTATYDFKANYLFMQATSPITTSQVISIKNIQIATSNIPYEPYGSNEWYIKKNIGKVVLDGTESNWSLYTSYNNEKYVYSHWNTNYGLGFGTSLCSRFKNRNYAWADYGNIGEYSDHTSQTAKFFVTDQSSLENWKTWLSTHNTIVYYVMATPTYTQITGTLETQLENVYQKLLSYDGTTNISQINNDLSFNMVVSAIEK